MAGWVTSSTNIFSPVRQLGPCQRGDGSDDPRRSWNQWTPSAFARITRARFGIGPMPSTRIWTKRGGYWAPTQRTVARTGSTWRGRLWDSSEAGPRYFQILASKPAEVTERRDHASGWLGVEHGDYPFNRAYMSTQTHTPTQRSIAEPMGSTRAIRLTWTFAFAVAARRALHPVAQPAKAVRRSRAFSPARGASALVSAPWSPARCN